MNKFQNLLATESIGKLLWRQSYPVIIGLIIISLYNIVDTIFIGRYVGSLGIAALSIIFPVQMIMMGVAQAIGIGAGSIISRALGAKNYEKAEKVLGNYFTTAFIIGIIVTILGLVFTKQLLLLFGATENILPFATVYLTIILYGTFPIMLAISGNNIVRAEGNAKFSMYVMGTSALTNLVLDYIFMVKYGMGIEGAAYATLIAQIIPGIIVLGYFIKGNSGINFHLQNLKIKLKTIKEIFAIGSSSLARMVSGSLSMIVINHGLGFYGGDIAIAAFGIIQRVSSIFVMPIMGIIVGMQPIIGFNYGAESFERVKNTIKKSNYISTLIGLFGFAIMIIFSGTIVKIFTTDIELIEFTTKALRIVIFAYPVVGYQFVIGGVYQSLGFALKAFFISALRPVLLLIPLALLLPIRFGVLGIFIAFPLADAIGSLISYIIYRKEKLNAKF